MCLYFNLKVLSEYYVLVGNCSGFPMEEKIIRVLRSEDYGLYKSKTLILSNNCVIHIYSLLQLCISSHPIVFYLGLSRPILKNLGFLGFLRNLKSSVFRFFDFQVRFFYFFMSNSVNLYLLIHWIYNVQHSSAGA